MEDLRVPVRAPRSVDAVVDGQRVALSPRDYAYFAIEGSGAAVWDLVDGERTVEDIVVMLESDHLAPEGTIRAETLAFLDALVVAGLVVESTMIPADT